MEKVELLQLVSEKLSSRDYTITVDEANLCLNAENVSLPESNEKVSAVFEVAGTDTIHLIKFDIKYPVSQNGDYDKFYNLVNNSNDLTTGTYSLEGESVFCSSYKTTYFNTKFEEMNVNRTLMFMFDSLLLEFSNILKNI